MKDIQLFKKPILWLGLVLILIWAAVFQLPDNRLHLVFCDVGQGDAALITYKSNQILIDGGPDDRVLNCLGRYMPFWDRKIEMVISTHPDADHLTGLIPVIERYSVRYLLINSRGKESGVFAEFKTVVLAEGAPVYFPKEGDQIKIGPLKMAFLWPEDQEKVLGATTVEKNVNETSVVFQLTYGEFEALFPGDITSKIETQLELKDIEILKVPHHGSKYSTSEEFLQKVTPELAVISVGKNSFGHPTKEVIERIGNLNAKILRTDQEGIIEVVVDDQHWGIEKQ